MEEAEKTARQVKRAPPQQQRAHDRIEAILAAAEEEVAQNGYDGLTMVSIAARAGITHTSIYRYFTSVEPILAMLISRRMADFDRGVEQMIASAETAEALIDVVVQSIEFGFGIYRNKPVMRGLWAATRYLPALRTIDDENTARTSRLFGSRFAKACPGIDQDEIYVALLMTAALTVPAYETALSQTKRLQKPSMKAFQEMVRARLKSIVGAASLKQP